MTKVLLRLADRKNSVAYCVIKAKGVTELDRIVVRSSDKPEQKIASYNQVQCSTFLISTMIIVQFILEDLGTAVIDGITLPMAVSSALFDGSKSRVAPKYMKTAGNYLSYLLFVPVLWNSRRAMMVLLFAHVHERLHERWLLNSQHRSEEMTEFRELHKTYMGLHAASRTEMNVNATVVEVVARMEAIRINYRTLLSHFLDFFNVVFKVSTLLIVGVLQLLICYMSYVLWFVKRLVGNMRMPTRIVLISMVCPCVSVLTVEGGVMNTVAEHEQIFKKFITMNDVEQRLDKGRHYDRMTDDLEMSFEGDFTITFVQMLFQVLLICVMLSYYRTLRDSRRLCAKDDVQPVSDDLYPAYRNSAGFCYLYLFPPPCRAKIKLICGAFPSIEAVEECYSGMSLPGDLTGFDVVELGSFIHIEPQPTSQHTVDDLFIKYQNVCVGGAPILNKVRLHAYKRLNLVSYDTITAALLCAPFARYLWEYEERGILVKYVKAPLISLVLITGYLVCVASISRLLFLYRCGWKDKWDRLGLFLDLRRNRNAFHIIEPDDGSVGSILINPVDRFEPVSLDEMCHLPEEDALLGADFDPAVNLRPRKLDFLQRIEPDDQGDFISDYARCTSVMIDETNRNHKLPHGAERFNAADTLIKLTSVVLPPRRPRRRPPPQAGPPVQEIPMNDGEPMEEEPIIGDIEEASRAGASEVSGDSSDLTSRSSTQRTRREVRNMRQLTARPQPDFEEMFGFAKLVTDRRREPEGGWETVSRDWSVFLNEEEAEVGDNVKANPSAGLAVRTKKDFSEVVRVPMGMSDDAEMALKENFPSLSLEPDADGTSLTPYRDAFMSCVRNVIMNAVGTGKRVLLVGDSGFNYSCDGYVTGLGPDYAGLLFDQNKHMNNLSNTKGAYHRFETERNSFESITSNYDVLVAFMPTGVTLRRLCELQNKLKAKESFIVMPCSPALCNDKLGHLPNLDMNFCRTVERDLLFQCTSEVNNSVSLMTYSHWHQYVTTQGTVMSNGARTECVAKQLSSDILLLQHTLVDSGALSTRGGIQLTTRPRDLYRMVAAQEGSFSGVLWDTSDYIYVCVPERQVVSLISQTQNLKKPKATTIVTTANMVEEQANKTSNPSLFSVFGAVREPERLGDTLLRYSRVLTDVTVLNLRTDTLTVLDKLIMLFNLYNVTEYFMAELLIISASDSCYLETNYLFSKSDGSSAYFNDEFGKAALVNLIKPLNLLGYNSTAARGVRLLGATTNDMTPYKQPDFEQCTFSATKFGRKYDTVEGSIAECVYKNPRMYSALSIDGWVTEASTNHSLFLIHRGAYTKVESREETGKSMVILLQGDRFSRVIPDGADDVLLKVLSNYVHVKWTKFSDFLAISSADWTDPGDGLCFYKAVGLNMKELIAGKETKCSSRKISEIMRKRGVAILHDKFCYAPNGWSPTDIKHLIYANEEHCWYADPEVNKNLLKLFRLRSSIEWSYDLNGKSRLGRCYLNCYVDETECGISTPLPTLKILTEDLSNAKSGEADVDITDKWGVIHVEKPAKDSKPEKLTEYVKRSGQGPRKRVGVLHLFLLWMIFVTWIMGFSSLLTIPTLVFRLGFTMDFYSTLWKTYAYSENEFEEGRKLYKKYEPLFKEMNVTTFDKRIFDRKYRRLSLKYHPDKCSPELEDECKQKFLDLSELSELMEDDNIRVTLMLIHSGLFDYHAFYYVYRMYSLERENFGVRLKRGKRLYIKLRLEYKKIDDTLWMRWRNKMSAICARGKDNYGVKALCVVDGGVYRMLNYFSQDGSLYARYSEGIANRLKSFWKRTSEFDHTNVYNQTESVLNEKLNVVRDWFKKEGNTTAGTDSDSWYFYNIYENWFASDSNTECSKTPLYDFQSAIIEAATARVNVTVRPMKNFESGSVSGEQAEYSKAIRRGWEAMVESAKNAYSEIDFNAVMDSIKSEHSDEVEQEPVRSDLPAAIENNYEGASLKNLFPWNDYWNRVFVYDSDDSKVDAVIAEEDTISVHDKLSSFDFPNVMHSIVESVNELMAAADEKMNQTAAKPLEKLWDSLFAFGAVDAIRSSKELPESITNHRRSVLQSDSQENLSDASEEFLQVLWEDREEEMAVGAGIMIELQLILLVIIVFWATRKWFWYQILICQDLKRHEVLYKRSIYYLLLPQLLTSVTVLTLSGVKLYTLAAHCFLMLFHYGMNDYVLWSEDNVALTMSKMDKLSQSGTCYLLGIPFMWRGLAIDVLGVKPTVTQLLRFMEEHNVPASPVGLKCKIETSRKNASDSRRRRCDCMHLELGGKDEFMNILKTVRDPNKVLVGGYLNLTKTCRNSRTRAIKDTARGKWLIDKSKDLMVRMKKTREPRKKAMIEAVLYSMEEEQNLISRLMITNSFSDQVGLQGLTDAAVYDKLSNRFLTSRRITNATIAWDGDDFIEVKWSNDRYEWAGSTTRIVISESYKYDRERRMVNRKLNVLNYALRKKRYKVPVTLINGVPGCGKTHRILKVHSRTKDVVLTATVSGREEYVDACKNESEYDRRRYRTYDSLILNGSVKAETLRCDEGFMVHFGELLLCAAISNANSIEVSGDNQQLPFISRCFGFETKYHILNYDVIAFQNLTYRLPKDIVKKLKLFYPKISTKSAKKGEIRVLRNTVAKSLPGYDAILTFTQGEKQEMSAKNPGRYVRTIHEVQGKTFGNVALVRLRTQKNPLYDSAPHLIVGCSRHTTSVHYHTIVPNDSLSKLLRGNLSKDRLSEEDYVDDVPVSENRSGAMPNVHWEDVYRKRYDEGTKTFVDWIRSLMSLSVDKEITIRRKRFVMPASLPQSESMEVEPATLQFLLDYMYERTSLEKVEALKMESPFPLEPSVRAELTRMCTAMMKTPKTTYCKPKLITPQLPAIENNIAQVMAAIRKRNLNPPKLTVTRPKQLGESLADAFMCSYVDQDKLMKAMLEYPYGNEATFEDWLSSRTGNQLKQMEGIERKERSKNTYSAAPKRDPKPSFNNDHMESNVAGQNLAVHDPFVCAYFSEPVRNFATILRHCLKEEHVINESLSQEELNAIISSKLYKKGDFKGLEIDMSKFDKSQEEVILTMNCALMRRLGVPETVIKEWEKCHVKTKLLFKDLGIMIRTLYQRKSGDVFTFLGNTITTMAVMSYVYPVEEAILGLYGGDDSLILFPKDVKLENRSKMIAEYFNLEAKIEIFQNSLYFSSKYLLQICGRWLLVPDPLKCVFRLGRHDIYCKEHVERMHISFSDNYKMYKNAEVRVKSARASENRRKHIWGARVDNSLLSEAIGHLVDNKDKYLELFVADKRTWNRPMPTSLRERLDKEQSIAEELSYHDVDMYDD